ncbi:MAG: hypothetical protein V1886_00275 [archaeon]
MPERTEIEKETRTLIALDILYKPFSSLGDKGKRRAEKHVKNIANLLKDREEKGERIFARIEKKAEEKSRTLREGIDTFKKEYPKYGELLEKCIEKKRTDNNKYLVYGLASGFKLGEEDYTQVMMDMDFTRREANSVYPHILAISERLGKAKEQAERKMLISPKD